MAEPKALPPSKYAERYAICESTVWRWIKLGQVKTIKVGGRTFIPVEANEVPVNP
jgi:hypothetical protein